jgi:hypothetical protein
VGAAVLANTLFSALRDRATALRVDGLDVPLSNAAIKQALLGAVTA